MKRLIIAFITWMLVGVTVTAAWAAGPAKPVIEAEMPDCYSYIGGSGITLYTNASASDGGTLKYQWYVTDIENMAMIRAIDYAEGDSYQGFRSLSTTESHDIRKNACCVTAACWRSS